MAEAAIPFKRKDRLIKGVESSKNPVDEDESTKPKLKASPACKGRTNTQRAPQRVTEIKSQVNRNTLKRVAKQ
jgi:hypothetical protein